MSSLPPAGSADISVVVLDVALLFVFALIGVLLPLSLRKGAATSASTIDTLFNHGNAFAAGVLLSAALVHLLPQAGQVLTRAMPELKFPLAEAFAILGAGAIFTTDHVLRHQLETSQAAWGMALAHQHSIRGLHIISSPTAHNERDHDLNQQQQEEVNSEGKISCTASHEKQPLVDYITKDMKSQGAWARKSIFAYLLFAVLSFHSLMEGLALGSSLSDRESVVGLLFAILSHKFLAAFALGVSLISRKCDVPERRIVIIALSFASVSPLGALLGYIITSGLQGEPLADAACGIFLAISAGIFTYLAFELLAESFRCESDVAPLHDDFDVDCEFHQSHGPIEHRNHDSSSLQRLVSFFAGATGMTVLAIWI